MQEEEDVEEAVEEAAAVAAAVVWAAQVEEEAVWDLITGVQNSTGFIGVVLVIPDFEVPEPLPHVTPCSNKTAKTKNTRTTVKVFMLWYLDES